MILNPTDLEHRDRYKLLITSALPRDHSEFEWADLTPIPGETIRVPRVAEAPISFECKLQRIVVVSDQPGGERKERT